MWTVAGLARRRQWQPHLEVADEVLGPGPEGAMVDDPSAHFHQQQRVKGLQHHGLTHLGRLRQTRQAPWWWATTQNFCCSVSWNTLEPPTKTRVAHDTTERESEHGCMRRRVIQNGIGTPQRCRWTAGVWCTRPSCRCPRCCAPSCASIEAHLGAQTCSHIVARKRCLAHSQAVSEARHREQAHLMTIAAARASRPEVGSCSSLILGPTIRIL